MKVTSDLGLISNGFRRVMRFYLQLASRNMLEKVTIIEIPNACHTEGVSPRLSGLTS